MKKAFDDYTFLAGGSGMRGSLWKGPDHLLVIEARGFLLPFSEVYRRIDYKNIQALTLTETRAFVWLTVLMVIPLMALMAAAIAVISSGGLHGAAWALLVGIAALLGLLGVHLTRGRTCACSLQTAVLSLRLRSLKRKAPSSAVIDELAAICRHHQGELPIEPQSPVVSAAPIFDTKQEWLGSALARNTLFVALLWGVLLTGELFVANVLWLVLGMGMLLTTFFMLIPTLVRVSQARAPGTLRAVGWSLMVTTVLGGVAYTSMFVAAPRDFLVWMATLDRSEARWAAPLIIGLGAIVIFLSALGLPSTFARRSLVAAPNPTPPPPPTAPS